MANSNIATLLKEYDKKRINALNDLDLRKEDLYSKNPRLEDIEKELNSISIKTVKSILIQDISSKEALLLDLNNEINKLCDERLQILKSLGKDKDFLEPIYECKLCNDTGYILSNASNTMCNCLKQGLFNLAYNKSNLNNLENENFHTFDFSKYSELVDFNKYKSNISPRDNMKNIISITKNFIDNFDSTNQKNLLFTGNTGLGKTFLSNCIANEFLKLNKTVLYQTSTVLLDSIIDYRFGKTNNDFYNNVLSADLLIIDDLGTETINSMKFTELFNIINTRLLSPKSKTIISTNLSLNELLSRYDERIFSRFVGHYDICKFFGDDIRLKK